MEMNDYAIEILARQRLEEARAFAARRALLARLPKRRSSVRARLGAALIALGERIMGPAAAGDSRATHGATHA
jgi:hypothetical protein